MNTQRINKGNVKMIAHRGVSGLEKENTAAAFVAAGNRSYFGVETDVHCTADGKFIVIHDDTTTRVTGVERVVEETDFDTLRAMRLLDVDGVNTRGDLCMPTLEEYIGICKKYEKVAVLELKNPMPENSVFDIVDVINKMEYLDKTVFISFDFDNLVYVRKRSPEQKVQFLFKEFSDDVIERVKKHGFDVDVRYTALTREIIEALHADGIEVNCWTVNEKEDAERLISWGIDYITTNILE